MKESVKKETAIRQIVSMSVKAYAEGFKTRHICDVDNDNGVINMKIHNIFIAELGPEIQFYSALSRSLDSSLGNMLEKMAISIAKLSYVVGQCVEGPLYADQTKYIATLLEGYKRSENRQAPQIIDYKCLSTMRGESANKRHDSDYYLYDEEFNTHYLIELKIGGDLDNKKARSEKEALLEQYCILTNKLGSDDNVKILFATAYNRFGEGKEWRQGRVLQFFSKDELCISQDFWNLVCKSSDGFDVVIDEYKKNAHLIREALEEIKNTYLPRQ